MRNALVAGLALIAAVTLVACGGGGGGGGGGGACGNSCNGCCLGTTCVAGTDPTGCGTGSKDCKVCASGERCVSGLCEPGVVKAVGDKCTTASDCPAGGLCAADVPGGGYCTAHCEGTSACPTGSTCVQLSASENICFKTCTSDANCRAEHGCFPSGSGSTSVCLPKCTKDLDCTSRNCDTSNGRCVSKVGNACSGDVDCGSAPAFCDTTDPSGYCSLPCGGQQNTPCPSGSNCSSVGGSSVCLKACSVPADCRAGFSCGSDASGLKSCMPKCTSDDTCPVGQRCQTSTGQCVEGGPAPGALGGACTGDPNCAALNDGVFTGAFCSTGYPGGYCSTVCGGGDTCPTGGQCVAFGTDKFCLSKCSKPTDCRNAYYCYDLGGGFGGVCTPKCKANTDCSAGEVCDKNSGQCVTNATGTTTLSTVDLTPNGPIEVSSTTLTAKVTLTLPADAIAVTFVGQAVSDPTARLVAYRLDSTADGRLFDKYGTATGAKMKVLAPTHPGAFALLYPNSPNVPFSKKDTSGNPTVLTVTLLGSKPTSALVKAIVKKGPTPALTAGNVDLNLFFVGLSYLSASSAQTDAKFKTIFDSVKSTWAKAGISVGTVNYVDLGGSDATQFTNLKSSELGELMKRSSCSQNCSGGTPVDNALNVFFVNTITGGSLDGYIILGESAGIPGVPIRGTSGSGMAVTAADYQQGSAAGLQDIADTWAHEGGHWMGLFHPTESAGTSFDPIPDTPECAQAAKDANADKIMQPSECVGYGADNEMFWTSVAAIAHSELSPNQSFVLLRNPAVH